MDYDELGITTMDPSTRTLKRITIQDAEQSSEAFNICMGKDASLRRKFIEENAHLAIIED